MLNKLIQQLLEKLTKNYSRDKKQKLPKTFWQFYQEDAEYLKSIGQLDAQELLSLQPSYGLSLSEIKSDTNVDEYNSYQEFSDEWLDFIEDKYEARLNQIIAWTIHQKAEYAELEAGEENSFLIHLVILQPRKSLIKNIFVSITKDDTPKIKRLLRKAAMFNLYNFSQAFK
jgi:hypothetical protein